MLLGRLPREEVVDRPHSLVISHLSKSSGRAADLVDDVPFTLQDVVTEAFVGVEELLAHPGL